MTVTFSEPVYGDDAHNSGITTDDFIVTFAQNDGEVSEASIRGVQNSEHYDPVGDENEFKLLVYLVDGPPTGDETIIISPKENSIFNSSGIAAEAKNTIVHLNKLLPITFDAVYPDTIELESSGNYRVTMKYKLMSDASDASLTWAVLSDTDTSPLPTPQQIKDVIFNDPRDNKIGEYPVVVWASHGAIIGTEGYFFIESPKLEAGTNYDVYLVAEAGNNNFSEVIKLDITIPTPVLNVCEIVGGSQYLTLDEALAEVPEENTDPVTIKLLDIADNDGIAIQKKKINLDLNGKTLTIINSSVETNSGVGIRAELNSDINVIGSGNLNIHSNMAGLSLNESKFITSDQINVNIIANNNAGIYADYSCIIVINGNVSGTNGIYASTDNNITVTGTATATGTGENHAVHLSGTNNTVYVGSAIVSSGNGSGVYNSSGTVTVGSESAPGKVDGKGSGIRTNSTVTVYGDVTGVSRGINASDGSTITVHGDVTSTGINGSGYGVYGFFNTTDITEKIIIDGDVIGPNGIDIHGDQSEVSVTGNVTARGTDNDDNIGVRASYAKVFVGGNVNASDCTGAYSAQASQITIDGTISATNYIKVKYGDLKAKGDNDAASTKPGYLQYSSQDAFVWVKGEQTQLPTITGTVAITGEAKLGETLTAVPTLSNSGTATYQWNSGGVAIVGATALTYELTEADITTKITVTATADGITGTGSITSAATAAVQKADGPAAPTAPTLDSNTHNSVTLTANAAYQFSKDDGLKWQDSNVFSGLSASTPYTFVARVKATATHKESDASAGLSVTTDTKPTSGGGGGGSLSGFAISTAGTTQEKYGAEMDIPRGAVSSDTRGDIDRYNSDKIDAPDDSFIPGNIFKITKKSSGDFLKPITVTLPYKASAVDLEKYDMSIYWYDEDSDEWVELDNVKIDEDDLTVSGETDKTGYFALIATKKEVVPPVETEPELPVLTDISGHWAKANIEHLVEMGAISGYPDNTFRPDNPITRAEFATVLVKAMGLTTTGSKVFADTTGHWAEDAISTAYAAGIISGYNEESFGPDDLINREQMAVMVVKAAGLTDAAPELKYADSQQISTWAREFVARAAAEKLISGYPDNTFRPAHNATRAEAVTVISQKW